MSNNTPDYQEDLVFPPEENTRRKQLLARLNELYDDVVEKDADQEATHQEADNLLLEYIGDPEISRAFNAIPKYYA